jgi:hypothetical protein
MFGFFLRRIEMAGRAGKRRAFAFANRVNMNRMQARSKSLDIHVHVTLPAPSRNIALPTALPSLSLSSAVA